MVKMDFLSRNVGAACAAGWWISSWRRTAAGAVAWGISVLMIESTKLVGKDTDVAMLDNTKFRMEKI